MPLSVVYNGTYYYYVTDLQGDVVAIVDTEGEKVVEYLFDAWGRLLETSGTKAADLGLHNPLRYRGYVYDPESGLYYLQSRYYNPELGRFINADAFTSTGQGVLGNNMFAYCNNNPVCLNDSAGTLPKDALLPYHYVIDHSEKVVPTNDGNQMSASLEEYFVEQKMNAEDGTVYIDVNYLGTYTKKTDKTLSYMLTLGGVAALFIPQLKFIGDISTIAGLVSFVPSSWDRLPDKDYHQYRVTMSWTTVSHPLGYPTVWTEANYFVELIYLWNDTSHTSPSWYLMSCKWYCDYDEYRF